MENAISPAIAPDPRFLAARAARLAYEDAVNSDGVTESAWRAIAVDLAAAAVALSRAGLPRFGMVEACRARAVDAEQRAAVARRMIDVARSHRPIDMSSVVAG